jgi:putative transposase
VILFAHIVFRLLADLVSLAVFSFRSRLSVEAENLLLRRQLGLYRERGVKPRRVDAAARASLAFISRLFDWRSALVVVRPETLIRWHRAGWRLLWRWKSRRGRPPIPLELRKLIRRMAIENPTWGEERIANELLLKLGLRVSPRTVRKYIPIRPPSRPRGDQRWSTFLKNHARAIVACDFFVTVTATFQLVYVLVVIEHGSRRLLHMNTTRHPTVGLETSAVTRSRWPRNNAPIPAPRSRRHLRQESRPIHRQSRFEGTEVTTRESEGEFNLRTRRRHDSTRVLGLADPDLGAASPRNS